MTSPLEFWDWLQIGIDAGWISEPACATHDGIPTTVEGLAEWEQDHDPCEHIVRLIPDDEHLEKHETPDSESRGFRSSQDWRD